MSRPSLVFLLFLAIVGRPALAGGEKATETNGASARSVIRELNLARQDPARYATFVEDLRGRMDGNLMILPGGARIRTKEGAGGAR